MKKTYMLFMVLVFVCSFGIYAFAEDTPEIYNKGKKVEMMVAYEPDFTVQHLHTTILEQKMVLYVLHHQYSTVRAR